MDALNDTYEVFEDDDDEYPEPAPSIAKKGPKTEKPKAKKDKAGPSTGPSTGPSKKQPTVYEIVHEAIENIGVARKGASAQAIKKYVHSKSEIEEKRLNSLINKALLKGIANGTFAKPLKQAGGGATGSFLLAKVKTKQTKRLANKKPVDVEHSPPDDIEEDTEDSETTSETREEMKYDFSDSDIEDIDEEEETPNLKSQKLPKANVKKLVTSNKGKANRTKKVNNEEAEALGNISETREEMNYNFSDSDIGDFDEEEETPNLKSRKPPKANVKEVTTFNKAKGSRTKKVNNEEAKASGTRKVNEEAKASKTRKVNEEAKASRTKKINNEEAKAGRTKKASNEAKASRTKKINNEEVKENGTKKVNNEEAKASGTKKANMKETKENATKKTTTRRNKAPRERADSSDSEVIVKKTGRKSMKAYSSDTEVDFVKLEDVQAPPKKPKVQAKGGKIVAAMKPSKPKAVKLYNAEANENNVKSGKARSKKET